MVFIIVLLLLSVYGTAGAVGVTHNVYGKLLNDDGSVPQDGDIQFTAYISTRPKEKIVHPGAAGSGYKDGWWVVNVGNFHSPWKIGEVLVVEFTNLSTGEWTVVEQPLSAHQSKGEDVKLKGDTPLKYRPRFGK
jgi:hypothetical protein